MAYGDFKDLSRRTASDKVLRDKACDIAKNPKYYTYQRGLASMVYNFFYKRFSGGVIKRGIILNQRPSDLATRSLAEETQANY